MKELNIFDKDGTINKLLELGDTVSFQYEYDTPNHTEYVEGKGIIIKIKPDTKYNDHECDEYIVKCDNNREEEIYGRDIVEAFR